MFGILIEDYENLANIKLGDQPVLLIIFQYIKFNTLYCDERETLEDKGQNNKIARCDGFGEEKMQKSS